MTYETFRQIADSWGLLYMFAIFIGVLLFMLRPAAKQQAKDAADIPFHEDR